eukprot:scaffold18650_cov245-Skeletonema_marinoi.AAC.1
MDLLHNLRRSERLRLPHIGEVSSLREGLPVVGVEQIVSDTQTLSTQSVVTSTPLPIGVSRTVDLPIKWGALHGADLPCYEEER